MAVASRRRLWIVWLLLTASLAGLLWAGLSLRGDSDQAWRTASRGLLLPGPTSHGHYQIELACDTCHTGAFADREAMQARCMDCHGAELKQARDSHPRSKFTDPRNADRAARLNAAECVTCHVEHRPELTHAAGDTQPVDFCVTCHAEVGKERPSHQGMGFETCASSGCHNFHDNRALYEDFLIKHAGEPEIADAPRVPARDFRDLIEELSDFPFERVSLRPLGAADADHGMALGADPAIEADWLASAHARSGVNCSGCHVPATSEAVWIEKPDEAVCRDCHAAEVKGFLAGRHGMRLAVGLSAMTPGQARLPMREDAADVALECTSCHGAHGFDTKVAQVESCLGCHSDTHSLAYEGSPHHRLWQREQAGELPAGSGVTCATCHLPRVEHYQDDIKRVLVQHNQNDTLRPNEKMIRPVCLSCHGLAFAIDALADPALVARNFAGRPLGHVESIDMVLEAERRAEQSRREAREATE